MSTLRLAPVESKLITKRELAAAIHRSERWIELKQREGLPVAKTDRYGRRRYDLEAVEGWMAAPKAERSTAQRLADLEREMQELRAMIEQRA